MWKVQCDIGTAITNKMVKFFQGKINYFLILSMTVNLQLTGWWWCCCCCCRNSVCCCIRDCSWAGLRICCCSNCCIWWSPEAGDSIICCWWGVGGGTWGCWGDGCCGAVWDVVCCGWGGCCCGCWDVGWDDWDDVVVWTEGCDATEDLLLAGTCAGPGLPFPLPTHCTSRSRSRSRSRCCWCFRAFTKDEAWNKYQLHFSIMKNCRYLTF